MNKLIIGCGYLGQRVAALWHEQGQPVGAATRHPENFAAPGVQPFLCDVLDPQSCNNLPEADTVLYAIGLDRSTGAAMRSVYVDGLANVLECLPPPKIFIYISSSSVYGQTGGEWVDEDSPTQPEEDPGKIVRAAEQVLQEKMPDAVILRFAGIYGPGRLLRQKTIQAGEPIVADGNKWLNLIHVEDGARVVLGAESRARPGRIYNVCDDHPIPRHLFYTALAKHLGAPIPRFVTPPTDAPSPPHEKGNRRLRNQRLREELQINLRFPHYELGIQASIAKSTNSPTA